MTVHFDKHTLYKHLKENLLLEVQRGKRPFSWRRVIHRALTCHDRQFYFWYRIWHFAYHTATNDIIRKYTKKKLARLNRKYGCDISPEAVIGSNMRIAHFPGLVVRKNAIIGKNVILRQNTTLGAKENDANEGYLMLGDNVNIGANACIIGNIKIGNNVVIGASSFINKNVPDNCVVYCASSLVINESSAERYNSHAVIPITKSSTTHHKAHDNGTY